MVKFTLLSMVADSTLYGFLLYTGLEADYRHTKNLKTTIDGGEKRLLTRGVTSVKVVAMKQSFSFNASFRNLCFGQPDSFRIKK